MVAFREPKDGYENNDCEDAVGYDCNLRAFSVSDGASASARSSEWSVSLVQAFLEPEFTNRLDPFSCWELARNKFESLPDSAETATTDWWASEVSRRGAFATFLGVTISEETTGYVWKSIAIGDTCVFHLRNGKLLASSPLKDPSEFGSAPNLVSSSSIPTGAVQASGVCEIGDTLLGISDALAAWALKRSKSSDDTWNFICRLQQEPFRSFLRAARASGELEDDDVSLIRCQIIQ